MNNLMNFKDPHDVLIGPVVSEKSFELVDMGKYTFIVAKNSNKTEIKQAVETNFNVKVKNVNTLNRRGKIKRTRFGFGRRNNEKRAIVSLQSGYEISIYGTEQTS